MSDALATTEERTISYVPFGEREEIELKIGMVRRYLTTPTKSGKVPNDDNIIKFMMLCKARELNPWVGDAYLTGYDSQAGPQFSLITAAQAIFKRAENNPHFDGMESGVVVKSEAGVEYREGDLILDGETLIGGWCKVYRKDRAKPFYDSLALKTFNTNQSRWAKDPAGMIVKCFDVETEVLTDRGFQKFAEVTGRILQVTSDGLEPVEATPFVQDYDGLMVLNENQNLDFCVTPNHDMITTAGKIEAGQMYAMARLRPRHFIPRCITASRLDRPEVTDDCLRLCAAFACDGTRVHNSGFRISVSKSRKVAMLTEMGMHSKRTIRICAGDVSVGRSGRTITTKSDKEVFWYSPEQLGGLIDLDKQFDLSAIASLSSRQAKVLLDALVAFDGNVGEKSGVRRFYASRPSLIAAAEVAAVAAGESVSPVKSRRGPESTKDNQYLSFSRTNEIPVRKHGETAKEPSLRRVPNSSGKVWCVTVPSGVIVVRRNGFSMLCGNCAEASALRKAFPSQTGGLYHAAEMESVAGGALNAPALPRTNGQSLTATPDVMPVPSFTEGTEATDDAAERKDWDQTLMDGIDEYEPNPAHSGPNGEMLFDNTPEYA